MDEFQEIIELLDDERSYWRRVLIGAWATTKSRKEYTIINAIIALIVSLSTTALTDSGNWSGMLLYVQFVITLLISFLILQITSTPARIDRELRKKVQKRILKLEQQVQELALDIASIEHRIPRQKASIR